MSRLRSDWSSTAMALGFWSAIACTVLSLTYVIAQVVEWLGWLGSAGGPSSRSTPIGLAILLAPSLLLAPTFLILMIATCSTAPADRKVFGLAAIAFATVYTTLVSTVYFAQLTWVMPRLLTGRTEGLGPFLFEPFDSFLYAVDILGYSFMSLATVMGALALPVIPVTRAARRFLLANGAVLPFLVLQMSVHELIWIASLWAITFPGATWTLARLFRKDVGAASSWWCDPAQVPGAMVFTAPGALVPSHLRAKQSGTIA
jgi:hypothetical protein